jgi:DNA-binding response OmpR family regulator
MPKRVLVVDDDAAVTELLRRALGAAGFEVSVASDGEAGLRLARTHPPDLVITDIVMPRMAGLQLIGRLVEAPETSGVPVIVLSAHLPDHAPASWTRAVRLCLTKPFETDAVVAAVQTILAAEA